MRFSPTLSIYIGRQFLLSFLCLFAVFLLLILLIDSVELLRRAASKPDVSFNLVMQMAFMKLPHVGQKTFPFAILFGGMVAFWRLTRSNELVITRGAGVSAWQFMRPALLIALILGIIQITVFNPLASKTLSGYEALLSHYFKGKENFFSISKGGLWLRQANEDGQSVIHSLRVSQQGKYIYLNDVSIFTYLGQDKFNSRIIAEEANLTDGFWEMKNVWIFETEKPQIFKESFRLKTDMTLEKIQDSFAPPETMSFWDLPGFISTLENAGFSALRHRLYWHSLLATPLFLCAMVLIAATFTLRTSGREGGSFMIFGGLISGFVLYFVTDVIFALGLSESIPVIMAAWTPSVVSTLLGLAMLLHLEDG